MSQTKRHYSIDFKIKAVELSNLKGSLSQVAEELDISPKNLSRWKQQYQKGELVQNFAGEKKKTAEQLEIHRLKKSLRDAELERDILKKALGIFSKIDR